MMEVSVAVILKENSSDGSLVSVVENETLMPPRISGQGTEAEQMAEMYEQLFSQAELRAAVMVEAVKSKVDDQLRAHRERLAEGTHPIQH